MFGAQRCFVVEAVRSVLATAGVPIEIVVVTGREMPGDVVETLVGLPAAMGVDDRHVHTVAFDEPFNFSRAVNLGAAHASAANLLLLNDDVQVIAPGWLTAMLDASHGVDVGAVGAKLLFEDGTLQHAGHTYRTALGHVGFGLAGDAAGAGGILTRRRRVAGATAACLLVPFAVYDLVGGLCEQLPGNYNDVDLCLKIRAVGLDVIYEPAAVLYHFESRSRVPTIRPEELAFIDARWRSKIAADPFTPARL
ncbi:MAG: glycosyltransferase [Ilumatobacteraceae bacterium]